MVKPTSLKTPPFTHLRVRSHYSLLRSALSVHDIVARAKADGCKYVVLADWQAMYGTIEFYDAATTAGLIPVIGLECVYRRRPLLLIAKNNAGYANLLKVSTALMTNAEPDLANCLDGVAVIVLAHDKKLPELAFLKNAEWYDATDPAAPNAIACPLIDCQNEKEAHQVLDALTLIRGEQPNVTAKTRTWFYDQSAAHAAFNATQLTNVDRLLSGCTLDLSAFKAEPPRFVVPANSKNLSAFDFLQALCREGLKARFGSAVISKQYIDRLRHELAIIKQLGFCDYFLVVRQFIKFAKDEGILVGPGRGSAVGSLVAYALRITEVDPLQYGLIFERFLNPERKSPPDIDTDIMDTRRDEVIDYLFNHYPPRTVAHIVTFQRVKVKSALRDAGRVLNVNLAEINRLCALVEIEYDDDLGALMKNAPKFAEVANDYPQVINLATRLVGLPRQVSTHAAGIVVSGSDLSATIPLMHGLNNRLMTQFSMEYLERFGLIKMDLLGLRNLSTIHEVLSLAKAAGKHVPADLAQIPLNDQKTYALFSAGQTNGIFQFESPGMKRTLRMIRPRQLEDLALTSSLYRPGPQENIPTFVARRHHHQPDTYIYDKLIPILKSTHGIMVYQEQVIETARVIAGYDAAHADLFRRAVAKKDAQQLAATRTSFITGAINNGLSQKDAAQIFDWIARFASYGFNHSHAVAYSLIGYWMGYLKTHFFAEFICVLLTACGNDHKKARAYVAEAQQQGIQIMPPDINKSGVGFVAVNNVIYCGLNAIKGVGPEAINAILACRAQQPNGIFTKPEQALIQLLLPDAPWKVKKNVVAALVDAGTLDHLGEDPKVVRELYSLMRDGLMVSNYVLQDAERTFWGQATPAERAAYAQRRKELVGVDFADE